MKNSESFIIIEDLKEFVEKRSDIYIKISALGHKQTLRLQNGKYFCIGRNRFTIRDGAICYLDNSTLKEIISIFDPQYREKFLKYVK